ncbi:glycosyltransferase family 4 protein [Stenotrophomonas sp. 24(2023)]|uniref:glycosyltransferase family 4 protein n=1 Tax=Stenotrophomonas sp. 24(2023) TaxID=3068324 RepID=UPI0027DEB070|nr:glycosyltransferase family 4 protein [Stenotrophomonas sp. 24(2023)]WMJ70874.1 glycosyltransferase family 4 protein [Stenotrophomonas sp. 24(2023)]
MRADARTPRWESAFQSLECNGMNIRTLHITNAYPCEGTPEYGVFVKEQIESLPDTVHSTVVFINGREQGKKAYLSAIRTIRGKLGECDVVHCHHAYSLFVAALAGVPGRKPIVLSFLNDWTHEVKGLRVGWLKRMACRIAVSLASRVIFKSPVPAELAGNGKVLNLPNGVDADFFSLGDRAAAKAELGLAADVDYLLFVSSKNKFREQKRYDIFSKVIEQVRLGNPHLKIEELVMVGQQRQTVPLMFAAASVHVLTSDYEGSPNSVKESLSCGTPVVARDVGNVRDMLTHVPGSAVVADSDPAVIAHAVTSVLSQRAAAEHTRAAFLATGITRQVIAQRLAGIYTELAGAGRAPPVQGRTSVPGKAP